MNIGKIIKYWPVLGEIFEFLQKMDEALEDGKLSKEERSMLMEEFWDIYRAAKAARAAR